MDCGTRVHAVTPLPKKRFQRLCLKKNTNSCPPKSTQSLNKENELIVTNISGRLSSPGCRIEQRPTPTFVTIRRPRHIIPSPLTTSGSNLDSDTSQFIISGYFHPHSPKTQLAFSTPIDNNILKDSCNFIGSDRIAEIVQNESTNHQDSNRKTTQQSKEDGPVIDLRDESNINEPLFINTDVICDNITLEGNSGMESLKIFDKECYSTNVAIGHLSKDGYKTPEDCGGIDRKLTPKTASILDNLYGDVWKTTPGLFKKTKPRIDRTQKVQKFSLDDDDVLDKFNLLNLNAKSTTDTKGKRQRNIKYFFKSSTKKIDYEVTSREYSADKHPTTSHFDIINDIYVLKDCLKEITSISDVRKDSKKIDIGVLNFSDVSADDNLPCTGLHSDINNPIYMGLDNSAYGKIPNLPSCREKVDLTDDNNPKALKDDLKKIKNPIEGMIISSDKNDRSVIQQSLNDSDNFLSVRKPKIFNVISSPFLCRSNDIKNDIINSELGMIKANINSKINCLDLMTDNHSKIISSYPNLTDKKKPRRRIVTLMNIDKAINRKPCRKGSIDNGKEEIRQNEIIYTDRKELTTLMPKISDLKSKIIGQNVAETGKLRFKGKAKCAIKANTKEGDTKVKIKFTRHDKIEEQKDISAVKNCVGLNDHQKATINDGKQNPNNKDVSDTRIKSIKQRMDNHLKEGVKAATEKIDAVSKGLEIKKKVSSKIKPNSDKDHKTNTKLQKDIKDTEEYDKDDSDLFDTLINKEIVRINSNLDDSCQILTTKKKKINYFPNSSDSDNDSDRKLQNLHFDLQPKTLVFGSNGDIGNNKENYPDNGVKKKTVKKSVKERNLAQSSAISKANIPDSDAVRVHSFMASLADNIPLWRCDPDAKCFKSNFKSKRDELTKKLFIMFNENVFESKLPTDLPIVWSIKLTKTAGRAHNKIIKHRSKPNTPATITRKSRVELSTKVLDGTQRLRDTLAHELCHVATWLIDGQLKDGHGPCWKSWVARTLKKYPELVALPVCHTLDIHFKYTYKCMKCGYSISRHSKSIDTIQKRCGYCYGTLECIHNKKNKDGLVVSTPVGQKRQATGFALYVKENYGNVRSANTPHKEAMKYLGKQYAKMKIDNQEPQDAK